MWRRLVYWQGAYGYSRLLISTYAAQPSSTPGTLDGTVAGFSNAGIAQIAEGTVTIFTPTPIVATYPSVTQLARVTFLDTAANVFSLGIPAPKLSAFAADGITLLPATLSSLLTAALLDQLLNPGTGLAVNGVVSGILNGPARPGVQLTGV